MNHRDHDVNHWHQLSILPPARMFIQVEIEVEPALNRAHYSIEVRNLDDRTLVGLLVWPLRKSDDWQRDWYSVEEEVREAISAMVPPFRNA